VKALVESLAGNVGYVFLLDRTQGRGLTLTLWESEQAALASAAAAEQSRSTQQATGIQLRRRPVSSYWNGGAGRWWPRAYNQAANSEGAVALAPLAVRRLPPAIVAACYAGLDSATLRPA
jgi:hypothetical protein